jgi:hypothetical protein
MKLNLIFFFLISFSFGQVEQKLDFELKNELDEILKYDQIFREYSDSETTESRKSEISKLTEFSKKDLELHLWDIIHETDSINLKKVEKIFKKHGYPGKSLVGTPTNIACWYVIQHSDKIKNYFEIIKKAGDLGEIPKINVAMMEDRLLMSEGLEQIYGTQGAGRLIINAAGKEEFYNFIWPIKDVTVVNELRKKIGFKTTVEENAKKLGIDYKIVTLEDYKKLKLKK